MVADESNNNGFYEKKFFRGKCVILDLKTAHPQNSGLTLRIFLKFCTMNGVNSAWKLY